MRMQLSCISKQAAMCVKKGAKPSQREWTHPFLVLYALVLNVVKSDLSEQ